MTAKQFAITIFILLAAAAAVIFSVTGSDEVTISDDEKFVEFISAYTTGMISRESTIQIRLVQAFQEGESNEISEPQQILKFDPPVDGQTYWLDNQTIEFAPEEKLEPNTKYTATFALGKVIKDEKLSKPFVFKFQTLKRQMEVKLDGLISISRRNTELQKLAGRVETSDVENIEEIKKVVHARLGNSELKFNWFPGATGKIHKFEIDSLVRNESPRNIKLEWDASVIDIKGKGELFVTLPALTEFTVSSVNVIHNPEQYISVKFTDPIKSIQNLKGLISVGTLTGLRYEVVYNEVKVYPPNRLYGEFDININGGIKNTHNYKMSSAYKKTLVFENLKPQVELIGKGVIVPDNDKGFILPFKAVNLSAVDVFVTKIFENNMSQFLQVNRLDGDYQLKRVGKPVLRKTVKLDQSGVESLHKWNRFVLDLNELSTEDAGAVYRVKIGFRKSQSLYYCSGNDDGEDSESISSQSEADEDEQSYWDYYDEYYYYDYDWRYRDDPCHKSYYGARRSVAKNLIHSNIGIIAKKGTDGSHYFITTNISTGKPLSGVQLSLLDYQKQVVAKIVTNSEGIANTKINDKVFIVIAEQDNEKGYLRMVDGASLSLSRFDIAGSSIQKGTKGFLYGDRGVWRPGDSLFITFILEDLKENIPENHPIVFELRNPRQQLVKRFVKKRNESDFYSFKFNTEADAPTGNWNAKISIGGIKFSKQLKIETVKPNRLKIKFDIDKPYLTKSSKNNVVMSVNWLHGAIGKNLEAKVDVNLQATRTTFNKYSDYTFDDPVRRFDSEPQTIFEDRVDEKGEAVVNVDIQLNDIAPGKLTANFLTKAFEPGGDFSIDRFSIDYNPYETYVGIKLPKGDKQRGMLLTDKDHKVEIVTLDVDGNPVSNKRIELRLYKVAWRWWWDQSADNQSNYSNNFYRQQLATGTVTTQNGKAEWSFNIKYPQWGRYIVVAKDLDGGHQTGKIKYVDWPGWAGRARKDNPGGAAMLTFTSDKEKYKVGEEIELMIPGSETGRSLISIESGSKVLETFWLEMENGENKFRFTATEEMTPNVYAHVTLLQPHAESTNDLPIRLYGILPIFVENPGTHLNPEISMPDVLRPEESFKLTVSERNDKEMTYTIAVVDEGLLDLTRFKTPSPWNHFYQKEALGVKTWDLYDLVIGAFGGKLDYLLSLGGGEFQKPKGGTKVNRFKPMVKFLGPFTIDGDENTHTIDVPRYVGSVRTMVIAGHKGAYGSVEKTTPVRKPLMVLGTLPRVLGPGESVELPVSVFAMEDHIKNVSVKLKHNEMFDIMSRSSKEITFDDKGDKLVKFRLRTKRKTGIAKVEIEATSGSEKALYNIELEVRNPNPIVVDVKDKLIAMGEKWIEKYKPYGTEGTNKCMIEVSSIPPINLGYRLNYLIRYPHGCVEQTTSGAFPQLYLDKVVKLTDQQRARTEGNIRYAVTRLSSFQNATGGLSYWPGGSGASDWGTTFAGHFLLEAQKLGYSLPSGFLNKWIKYQRNQSRKWTNKASRSDLAQAYRLYTLALAGQPEIGAMNRLLSTNGLSKTAKFRLAAAYTLAGKPEVAENLILNLDTNIKDYTELGNTFGSSLRDKAMILETLNMMGRKNEAFSVVKSISESLNQLKWFNTQAVSYSLLAIGKYAGTNQIAGDILFEYTVNNGTVQKISSNKSVVQEEIQITNDAEKNISVLNRSGFPLYTRLILEGRPITGKDTDASNRLKINVSYMLMDGTKIDPVKIEQGTDFIAEVTVSNPSSNNYLEQMELHQIFPSGWEIINTRLVDMEYFSQSSIPDYQDIRDDRVYTFYSLQRNKSKTFRIVLNASYLGRYYLPAVYSQAMYDNTINARKHGKWVEVVLPGK